MPTPQQRKKLRDALINAFPEKSRLEQMLYFQLGKNLNEITRDSDLQDVAFKLIQTAEAQGWLCDLVSAARKENPGNSELAAIFDKLFPIVERPHNEDVEPIKRPIREPTEEKFYLKIKKFVVISAVVIGFFIVIFILYYLLHIAGLRENMALGIVTCLPLVIYGVIMLIWDR